jgi:hypothetical protein
MLFLFVIFYSHHYSLIHTTVITPKLEKVSPQLAQKRIEEERMHDVLLLLAHLMKSEEATLSLMLDCLYDVGSVNLINKKLRNRPLNVLAKSIARMSKPVFRIFALRWVQKNCPRLATRWLYAKVSFPNLENKQLAPVTVVSNVKTDSLSEIDNTSREEIKRLRSEVRYLAGISAGALAALATTVIWVGYSLQPHNVVSHTTNSNGNLATTPMK